MTLGDDLRTVPLFTLCISLEEVQVLSHFQTSGMEFYIFSFSGKFLSKFSRLLAFLVEKKEIPSPLGAGMARSSDEAKGAEIEDLEFDICLLT